MLTKASSRLYILRVCKFYECSSQELTLVFDSLIMFVFMYAIEVWACAYDWKYLSQIDKFIQHAVKHGYTNKRPSIVELKRTKDTKLWSKVTAQNYCLNDLLPSPKTCTLWERAHNYVLPQVGTERFKHCFINKCLFGFV